ncbi:YggS family pyridoxal phosphate-dependent enzyme [Aliifodinibius sp. S!AR15-10]|uniref:YggS family pyridoxal phosphate-dependent enzyme n=1 Tax=Aliifodinibius sp. S!AR15-10 TaxID=2950437 RepID=UPI0028652BBA|nr:YggS family pyridoxal phosphate-dependent enzyme [Aliifodinibius sp. S!AR15-10]MDR8394481.1 YggS family pyridoxal phosphate-dependent enzyme [Aliifodinibius sp. S!AR15-10]
MANLIQHNIQQVQERIAHACRRVGRSPEDVQIVLATKTVEAGRILKATRLGYPIIGENRVQEAEEKIEQLDEYAAELQWHFIGHLQSNKVNKVVRFASMIQSIDRMKIVQKLNRRLKKVDKTMDVLIQVNTSGEDSKYGIHPSRALAFVEKASEYKRLNIKGLMTIGLFSDDWPKVRAGFRQLREIRYAIAAEQLEGVQMEHLSMGMTNDFELAIEEGATMIRLGRAIFGERSTPDSYYWPGIESTTDLH